jgi:hypothetical protein
MTDLLTVVATRSGSPADGRHREGGPHRLLLKEGSRDAKSSLRPDEGWTDTVLSPDQVALLGRGCALVVGVAAPDGSPYATRAWGAVVHSADEGRVRLIVDPADRDRLASAPRGLIAVTATDVRNLRSVQLKGRVTGLEPAGPADLDRSSTYFDQFARDVYESDGTERWLFERFVPLAFAACEVTVDEVYDQTPGPSAGASLGARAR